MPSTSSRTGILGGLGAGVGAFGLSYRFTYALSIAVVRDSAITQLPEAFGDGRAALAGRESRHETAA